jgi:hypothetical protein
MQIDKSEEQFINDSLSIHESINSGSNVTVESDLHPEKHSWQSVSTEDGMQIDKSEEQFENAALSMHKSSECAPKVTVESELHPEKHAW